MKHLVKQKNSAQSVITGHLSGGQMTRGRRVSRSIRKHENGKK